MNLEFKIGTRDDVRNSPQRKAFYQTVCDLGKLVQSKTSQIVGRRASRSANVGIKASLVVAQCIYRSNWGEHPLAQARFYMPVPTNDDGTPAADKPKWIYGNNLLLWQDDEYWHGDVIPYEGLKYKGFQNWGDFANHTSDLYSWSDAYMRIMTLPSLGDQLKQVCLFDENPDSLHIILWRIVRLFNLESIDVA